MKGFLSSSEVRKPKRAFNSPQCGKCGLHKDCNSPKMEVGGEGKVPVYWFAEAPGALEDKRGTQLCGKAGKYLRRMVKRVSDIDIEDCFKDNALRCRPPDNRDPKPHEIESCRPNAVKSIKEAAPQVIVPMGSHAVKSLLGHTLKKDIGSIMKWRGATIPDYTFNAWICPTFHPSYVMRETTPRSAKVIMRQDIERAMNLVNTPLPQREDDTKCVEILRHPEEIREHIKDLIRHRGSYPFAAFDYETTGLKPYRKGHEIICVSICTEAYRSVAFPMLDEIKSVFCKFLRHPEILKVAQNLKYEEAWSREILGQSVVGWLFDTMVATHILDNREDITSLKHQVYRRYGVADYDSHINPMLRSKKEGGNEFNQIHKIAIRDLLMYCGLDALYEFRLALDQMEELRPRWFKDEERLGWTKPQ